MILLNFCVFVSAEIYVSWLLLFAVPYNLVKFLFNTNVVAYFFKSFVIGPKL
jgi:hypothetical protein